LSADLQEECQEKVVLQNTLPCLQHKWRIVEGEISVSLGILYSLSPIANYKDSPLLLKSFSLPFLRRSIS
jgi:hypothetical protein